VRLGLVSDIHANVHAFAAVLEDLADRGVERLLCLGDIVGYNAHPNECVALLRKHQALAVMGNHDWAATEGEPEGFNPYAVEGVRFSRRTLTGENRAWLAALPRARKVALDRGFLGMYHGSPREPLAEYVFPSSDPAHLDELARAAGAPRAVALGHTHLPMRRGEGTVFLNPGSVGQPRDGDPRASYAVLDGATLATEFYRVGYDVDAAAKDVRDAGLPEFLWQRLLRGL
jgi:predicted phosphodiesterase